MDRQEIRELLKEVLGPNTELVNHTKWVSFCCPLARWTHAGGRDASPSSGISIKDGGTSIFHCWGCGSKGTVPWLLRELEKYTGESYRNMIESIEDGEFLGGTLPEWGSKLAHTEPDLILSDEYLDLYDSAVGHWYLKQRGITRGTARDLGLLLDPSDAHGAERIVFPVFTQKRQLQGLSGRAVLDDVDPRVRDYHGLQKERCLLGIHLVDKEDPHVLVVEGLFDMAMVYQYGYSVVATMHAGLTDFQADRLINLGMPLVVMQDNDAAGVKGTATILEKIGNKLPVSTVTYPTRGHRLGSKKCPKDPATCTMEEIDLMVQNAEIA